MGANVRAPSPWPRRICALLYWSGFVVAGVSIVRHGLPGMLVGYAVWVLAGLAAARADPSKWPR